MKYYLFKGFRKLLLIAGITASAMTVMAQQTNAFSAQQAVDYALKNTVQVKNALLAVQIQKQTNREVTAAALPQINGNVNYTNYLNIPTSLLPGEFFGQPGTYIPVQFGVKHNLTYGVDLQQLLFDGQVFVGLQARKSTMDFAQKAVEVTQEQIKANVMKIYYQVQAGRQQIATIDANITRFEKLFSDTKEIFKNGFAEKLDVDKTEVTLTNLKTQKLKSENQIIVALEGLKLLMGMPSKDSLILKDTIREDKLKENIAEEVYSYTDRKEFQQVQLQEKLNEYNIKRYQLTYIPTLSVSGNYSRNAQRQEFNFFKTGKQWFSTTFIGVKLAVPIFDGFAKDARIKGAKLALQQTQNNRENLKLSIDEEVEVARVNIRTAIASMDFQKKNMALAEAVYNQTKLKFEQGLGSNTEITTSQSELTTAQNNYFSALYDAIIARIDFLKATGKL
jgi:outer membrane protein